MSDRTRPTHRRGVGRVLAALGVLAIGGAAGLVVVAATREDPTSAAVLETAPAVLDATPSTVAPRVAATPAASTEEAPEPSPGVPLSPLAALVGERSSAVPAPVAPRRVPTSVTIEDIDLWAPIRAVGLEADGQMEIPDESEVGWYRLGSSPGRTGATVLAAHVTWHDTIGPFHRLGAVEPGALVEVSLDDGTTRTYQVVERAMYPKLALPAERIWRTDGPEELVLITCGGEFDRSIRRYRDNIVVFAVPVA